MEDVMVQQVSFSSVAPSQEALWAERYFVWGTLFCAARSRALLFLGRRFATFVVE